MTKSTRDFLTNICQSILGGSLDHDCRKQDGCSVCGHAQEALDEIRDNGTPYSDKDWKAWYTHHDSSDEHWGINESVELNKSD